LGATVKRHLGSAKLSLRLHHLHHVCGNSSGTGQSPHRVVDGNYGNDVANWTADAPTPGESAAGPGPLSIDLNIDESLMYQNLPGSANSDKTPSPAHAHLGLSLIHI